MAWDREDGTVAMSLRRSGFVNHDALCRENQDERQTVLCHQ